MYQNFVYIHRYEFRTSLWSTIIYCDYFELRYTDKSLSDNTYATVQIVLLVPVGSILIKLLKFLPFSKGQFGWRSWLRKIYAFVQQNVSC